MKKHYIKKLFATVAVLLCSVTANAHDFEVGGIYYNILSGENKTVKVTYKGTNYGEYSYEYSGSVVIPESVTYNGTTYSVTSIGDDAFRECDGLTSVTIPNSVTSIGNGAFEYCDKLTSVTIPNSVTTIGGYAFFKCSKLEKVTIPNSVINIGGYAFDGCLSLTSIEIPNSVTTIGQSAFGVCVKLTNITIPNSVTSLGIWTFDDCTELESIIVDEGNPIYDSRDNCNAIIESATNTLIEGCKNTNIPNSITRIGDAAFSGRSNLTSIIIPKSVTSIGKWTFEDCRGLTSIYLLSETPPSVGKYNFTESQYANVKLYIPTGTLETYQTADTWKNFGDIREVKKCATPVITYNNSGLDITCETDGAEIHTDITCNDVNSYNGGRIDLSAIHDITTYATKSGYLNSEIVTATLCWIAVNGSSEENGIIEVEAMPVLITCNNGTINISGGKDGAEVVVYTTSGVAVGTTTIENGSATIATGLSKGTIAIIKIGEKSVKVII